MSDSEIMASDSENKYKGLMWHSFSFPVLMALACAAAIGGTSMQLVHGKGSFGSVVLIGMLKSAIQSGNFSVIAGYAGGYLFARVLEGPLVGILDIGGSICTGVAFGVSSLIIASGGKNLIYNFPLALLTGAVVGLLLGILIEAVRKGSFTTSASAGTGIMMGAGNSIGAYFGPVVIICAIQYSILAGIGAIIGSALMYWMKKPVLGGAVIGAMLLGVLGPMPK